MKKLFTYIPVAIFVMVLIFLDDPLLKNLLAVALIFLIIISKYTRNKISQEEIEFDDRVNTNITKWSLKFMFFSNLLLILILLFTNQSIIEVGKYIDFIIFYLVLTLSVPFYLLPTIIKRY